MINSSTNNPSKLIATPDEPWENLVPRLLEIADTEELQTKLRKAEEERDSFEEDLEDVEKERDELKAKVASLEAHLPGA